MVGRGYVPHSTTPLPLGKVCLWCIFFALLVTNGPLPVELKFRENTGLALSGLLSLCLKKRFCFGGIIKPLLTNMDECLPCSFLHLTSSYSQKVGKKNLALVQPSCVSHAFSVGTSYCSQVTYFVFIAQDNVRVTESNETNKT